jgi:hypothetical protein
MGVRLTKPDQNLTLAPAGVEALRTLVDFVRAATSPIPDPSGNFVERLHTIFQCASVAAVVGPYIPSKQAEKERQGRLDGIRAVLRELAEMGVGEALQALPTIDGIVQAWPPEWKAGTPNRTAIAATLDMVLPSFAPHLAALRAENATLRERVERVERERDNARVENALVRARADAAESRLARVQALTEDDLRKVAECLTWGAIQPILALIRSRIEEGAEACCDGVAYCREHNPGGRLA